MRESIRFLGAPIYSLQTMLRKISSANPCVLPLIPDGRYGTNTYASVKSFQQYLDLPDTGVVDYTTWRAIVREYDNLLPNSGELYRPGNLGPISSSNLHILQAALIVLSENYKNGIELQVTGELDPSTIQAIKWIQQLSGLEVTGLPDILTQNALRGIYRNSNIQ